MNMISRRAFVAFVTIWLAAECESRSHASPKKQENKMDDPAKDQDKIYHSAVQDSVASSMSCSGVTCENGGSCVVMDSGLPQCDCQPLFTGQHCQLDALTDIAHSICGATCTASSQPGSCYNAIDGDLMAEDWFVNYGESNSWIEISFYKYYLVVALQIRQRCHQDNQNKGIDVKTSDGSSQSFELNCHDSGFDDFVCVDTYWQNYDLIPKVTKSVRIEVNSVCRQFAYNGFKEINIYGYNVALYNIASLNFGSTCNASSAYHPVDYRCEKALDDNTDPSSGGEWASDTEGVGAWIQIYFPGNYDIVAVDLLPRCAASMQILQVRADFSGGEQYVFPLVCNGGANGLDCEGQDFQTFKVSPALTASHVRFTITSICMTENNHGFREIRVYAIERGFIAQPEPTAEIPGTATAEPSGSVRLINGSSPYEGRVEFLHEGVWGTVCDDGWDYREAQVVCRQLGYLPEAALSFAHFGQGTGPIWLDDVDCAGTETDLADCPHNGIGVHNCGQWEDAGVSCLGSLGTSGPPDANVTFCGMSGTAEAEVETVTVSGETFDIPITVDPNGDRWMMLVKVIDGSVSFKNYDWASYVNGFGDLTGEFWLGLEKMHLLTTNGSTYTMRVDLANNTHCHYVTFRPFSVDDVTTDYTVHWGPVAPEQDLNDPLYAGDGEYDYIDGHQFTTFDNDNDNYDYGNCAAKYYGGWWYDKCTTSKLNGIYHHFPATESIRWSTLPSYEQVIVLYADMKIKIHS